MMHSNAYIDFHAHSIDSDDDIVTVFNLHQLNQKIQVKAPHYFSAGAHPWYLPTHIEETRKSIKELSKHPRFLAIGEIGLDRVKGFPLPRQELFLEAQMQLAEEIECPAVIFHCVRSFDLFLKLLNKTSYKGAFIFHDYAANDEITKVLLSNQQVFFSLGKSLMRRHTPEHLVQIPHHKIFLESDDHDYSVKEVYKSYAKLSGLCEKKLKTQINDNFRQLFGSTLSREAIK